MPNIQQILNGEIRRLARKEVKGAVASLLAANANLRNRIAVLEKKVKAFEKTLPAPVAAEQSAEQKGVQKEQKFRITPARIKQLREKLGVSQRVFAALAQVTVSSINNWEHGKTKPQLEQKKNLAALRGLGKRELAKKIAALKLDQKEEPKASAPQA